MGAQENRASRIQAHVCMRVDGVVGGPRHLLQTGGGAEYLDFALRLFLYLDIVARSQEHKNPWNFKLVPCIFNLLYIKATHEIYVDIQKFVIFFK